MVRCTVVGKARQNNTQGQPGFRIWYETVPVAESKVGPVGEFSIWLPEAEAKGVQIDDTFALEERT